MTAEIKEKIIVSALDLAAERGWSALSLADIAAGAGLSLAELREIYEDKCDILAGFGRMIDKRVLEGHETEAGSSVRDALFDLLMDRFEALNDYRAGVVAVLESFTCDPKQAVIGAPHLCRSMSWMLEAAGVNTSGWKGAAQVAGLAALYLKAAHVWAKDESADMAKVMAALDKDLVRAEKFIGMVGL